jgi:WD40 repeat protein
MSGQVHLSDLKGTVLQKRKDHTKYVVRVAVLPDPSSPIIATAGWDSKVFIYRPKSASRSDPELGEPAATIELPTKPESMVFVRHPDTNNPVLLVTRTDSTFIYYYTVTEDTPRLLGKQNLAPHSNAWVAFTPSSMDLCPTDPTLLAIGTSTVPHMKLLIVRLLFPPWDASTAASAATSIPTPTLRRSLLDDTPVTETQASQARAALLVADREDAAITIQTSTLAPQTPYSTPAVAWRPDGTGVWVNGDDGAVRGIEAMTGKVVSVLQGHEAGSKVRCLWAGSVEDENGQKKEVVVSGGFDHRLIVWEIE